MHADDRSRRPRTTHPWPDPRAQRRDTDCRCTGHPSTCRRRILLVASILLALAVATSFVGSGCSDAGTTGTSAAGATTTETSAGATTTAVSPGTTAAGPVGGTTSTAATGGSSRTTVTYAAPSTTDTDVPGMSGPLAESNALAREMKATLKVMNELTAAAQASGSEPDDATTGRIYTLRAQGQALIARRAIIDKQPDLADGAMRQCVKLLAMAQPLDREGATAVAAALSALADAPAPSQSPHEAASHLDEVIAALRPLVSQQSGG